MTKEQFLNKLKASLRGLSFNERQDILQDYEEHFALALEEGKSEEEVAEKLGTPSQIAKELLAAYHLEKVDHEMTTGNIIRAIWAVIGLGFFNLIIVLGPFIAVAAVIFSLWVVAASFIISPVLFVIDWLGYPSGFEWFNFFGSLTLCGIGIFIGIGMFYITKTVSRGFVRYLKYNASLVKGGFKHE